MTVLDYIVQGHLLILRSKSDLFLARSLTLTELGFWETFKAIFTLQKRLHDARINRIILGVGLLTAYTAFLLVGLLMSRDLLSVQCQAFNPW